MGCPSPSLKSSRPAARSVELSRGPPQLRELQGTGGGEGVGVASTRTSLRLDAPRATPEAFSASGRQSRMTGTDGKPGGQSGSAASGARPVRALTLRNHFRGLRGICANLLIATKEIRHL